MPHCSLCWINTEKSNLQQYLSENCRKYWNEKAVVFLFTVFQMSMNAYCTPVSVKNQLNVSTHRACMNASVPRVSNITSPLGRAMVSLQVMMYCLNQSIFNQILMCQKPTVTHLLKNPPSAITACYFFFSCCCRCGRVWVSCVRQDLYKHSGQLFVSLWRSSGSSFGRGRAILWTDPSLCGSVWPQTPWDALPWGTVCRPSCHLFALPSTGEHKVRVHHKHKYTMLLTYFFKLKPLEVDCHTILKLFFFLHFLFYLSIPGNPYKIKNCKIDVSEC